MPCSDKRRCCRKKVDDDSDNVRPPPPPHSRREPRAQVRDEMITEYIPRSENTMSPVATYRSNSANSSSPFRPMDEIALLKKGVIDKDSAKHPYNRYPHEKHPNEKKIPSAGMDEIALLKRGYIDKDSARHPYTRYHHEKKQKEGENSSKKKVEKLAMSNRKLSQKKTNGRKKCLGLDEIELLEQGMISKDSAHHLYNRYQHGSGNDNNKPDSDVDEIGHPYAPYHQDEVKYSSLNTEPISLNELKTRGLNVRIGKTVRSLSDVSTKSSKSSSKVSSTKSKSETEPDSLSDSSKTGSSSSISLSVSGSYASEYTATSKSSIASLFEPELKQTTLTVGRPDEDATLKVMDLRRGVRYELDVDKKEMSILQDSPDNIILVSLKENGLNQ